MAKVGLNEGDPRHTQYLSDRMKDRARDVLAALAVSGRVADHEHTQETVT